MLNCNIADIVGLFESILGQENLIHEINKKTISVAILSGVEVEKSLFPVVCQPIKTGEVEIP